MVYKNCYNVAILLTTFNSENFISQQIRSILNQKHVNVKIYISDDQSEDDTVNIINKFHKDFKNIEVLKNEQKFGYAGKHFFNLINRIDCKKFDFIAFSDHDDIWRSNKLIRGIKKLNIGNDGYSSSFFNYYTNKNFSYVNKFSSQKKYDYFFESPGPGSTFILKKKFFKILQNFLRNNITDSIYHHDWFIYAYARSNNFSWYIDKWPSIYYRQHSNNQEGSNIGIKAIIKRFYLVFSGFWFTQIKNICLVLNNYESNFMYSNFLATRFKRFKLLLIVFQCRRKIIDQIYLILFIILTIK